ncbi:MAG: HAD family hydrolase [Luminiphilus sp.]|nr:HAD family hydrolase [Luminiphilus sp.]
MMRAAFLDRDGVINVDHGYVSQWRDFEFLPDVPSALRRLQDAGYLLVVVSNQSGIGRGFYTEADLHHLNTEIAHYLRKTVGVSIAAFYHCPHHPTEAAGRFLKRCDCRKPAPGMIHSAARAHNIDLAQSILVGDNPSDIEAGRAAGVPRLFRVGSEAGDGEPVRGEQCVASLRDVPALL